MFQNQGTLWGRYEYCMDKEIKRLYQYFIQKKKGQKIIQKDGKNLKDKAIKKMRLAEKEKTCNFIELFSRPKSTVFYFSSVNILLFLLMLNNVVYYFVNFRFNSFLYSLKIVIFICESL